MDIVRGDRIKKIKCSENVSSLCRRELFVLLSHTTSPGALLSCTQHGAPSRQQQGGQSVFIVSQADRANPTPPTITFPCPGRALAHAVSSTVGERGDTEPRIWVSVGCRDKEMDSPTPKFIFEIFFIRGFESAHIRVWHISAGRISYPSGGGLFVL